MKTPQFTRVGKWRWVALSSLCNSLWHTSQSRQAVGGWFTCERTEAVSKAVHVRFNVVYISDLRWWKKVEGNTRLTTTHNSNITNEYHYQFDIRQALSTSILADMMMSRVFQHHGQSPLSSWMAHRSWTCSVKLIFLWWLHRWINYWANYSIHDTNWQYCNQSN